jgi:hypothetical protein
MAFVQLASTCQKAEFYISCAQLNVSGGGSGTPGPLIEIPSYFTGKAPEILVKATVGYFESISPRLRLKPTTYVQSGLVSFPIGSFKHRLI